MADGVKRAVDFVDAETQDATARSKCDELSTSIEQLEAALKEAVAARDAALRQESAERRKQDKLQTKERAKDAIQSKGRGRRRGSILLRSLRSSGGRERREPSGRAHGRCFRSHFERHAQGLWRVG